MTSPFTLFPAGLIQGQKVPLINGWQKLATRDPMQLQRWQEEWRDRLTFWGIPTGQENDLFVLDVDFKPGDPTRDGFITLQDAKYPLPRTLTQRTLSGGLHYFFRYPKDGHHYGNKVKFLPGLDTRGTGGWVAFYGKDMDWSIPIQEAPVWLLNLTRKQQETRQESNFRIDPTIAQGIFNESLERIRNAAPGESNNVLNIESFKVGQLVASNAFSREVAEQELFLAAKARGKPDYEAKATIKSGLDGGLKNPLTCPFPNVAPVALTPMELPPAPEAPTRWTPKYFTKYELMNRSKLRKPQLFQDWSTEDITITTADGGTGKTTLKLYEAVCLALGDRFLGFDCKQPGGKTLFITGEDTAEKLGAMLGAICQQIGILEDEAKLNLVLSSILVKKDSDLCLIAKTKDGFLHASQSALTSVLQAVEDFRPKMIVFDPIASFWGSESALNDMNKAVSKFMSELAERSGACIEMINHMGKASSASKDMTQFAGRGGTGLPSHSRVSRVLRPVDPQEFRELTGEEIPFEASAMMCNVNKFTDGSPLYNKPFLILRNGYIFSRKTLSDAKEKEVKDKASDCERIFTFIREARSQNKYPSRTVIVSHFKNSSEPISAERSKQAIATLEFSGHMGELIKMIENPDRSVKEKAFTVVDAKGEEVVF